MVLWLDLPVINAPVNVNVPGERNYAGAPPLSYANDTPATVLSGSSAAGMELKLFQTSPAEPIGIAAPFPGRLLKLITSPRLAEQSMNKHAPRSISLPFADLR
jgi:hypothetical protein